MSRVLVIDDDQVFAKLISIFLLHRGDEVVTALDGLEGLRQFKPGVFDVVICDIVMPNREGIETIRELRRLDHNVPIIAISGGLSPVQTANVDVLDLAEMMGADISLKKPFPLSELAAGIERAVADRHAATRSAVS
jgi:DNA-binding response OmpR family regulator